LTKVHHHAIGQNLIVDGRGIFEGFIGSYLPKNLFVPVYDMLYISREGDVRKIKQFALDMRLEVWFSVSPVRSNVEFDENGVPSTIYKYEDLIDALIGLKYNEEIDKVVMTLVRHEGISDPKPMRVTLDPKTMMIST
jgi:hypothetical protein